MKLSKSNSNLRSPDCYLVRSYLIATVIWMKSIFKTQFINNFLGNMFAYFQYFLSVKLKIV